MIRHHRKIAAALLAMTAMTPAAYAQDSNDVLVMRRTISEPGLSTSPDGKPVYNKVPLTALIVSANGAPPTSLTISTRGDVACLTADNQQAPEGACAEIADPESVAEFNIAADSSSFLRAISISKGDILTRAPSITNIDQICSSSVNVNGAAWQVTCEPLPAVRYLRTPGTPKPVEQPGTVPAQISFDTTGEGSGCLDQQTGTLVDKQFCSQAADAPGYGVVTVSVKAESELRTMVFAPDDLKGQIPTITQDQLNGVCSTNSFVGGLSWRVRCDEAALVIRHRKEATRVIPQGILLPYPTAGKPNFNADLGLVGAGVQCTEIATGQPASDPTICDYMTNPPGIGSFSLPATYSPSFRTVVVERSKVLEVVPASSSTLDSTLCNYSSNASVIGGSYEQWSIRCELSAISAAYLRVATQAVINGANTGKPIGNGKPDFVSTMTSSVSQQICRDTATGQPSADSTRCNTLPALGPYQIPATFSPSYRVALVNRTDVLAKMPEITNLESFCSGQITATGSDLANASYSLSCNPESIRLHHQKTPSRITPSQYKIGTNVDGRPNETIEWSFNTTYDPLCVDTDTNPPTVLANNSKCAYLADPANYGQNVKLTGTFSPSYRKLYVPASELQRIAPFINLTNACKEQFTSGDYKSWNMTCNPEDVRVHHQKIIHRVTIAYAGTATLKSGPVKLASNEFACRDTDEGKGNVADTFCQYMANPPIPSANIPVTRSDEAAKTLWVSRSNILSLIPTLDINHFCSSTTIDNQQYKIWNVRCDP